MKELRPGDLYVSTAPTCEFGDMVVSVTLVGKMIKLQFLELWGVITRAPGSALRVAYTYKDTILPRTVTIFRDGQQVNR